MEFEGEPEEGGRLSEGGGGGQGKGLPEEREGRSAGPRRNRQFYRAYLPFRLGLAGSWFVKSVLQSQSDPGRKDSRCLHSVNYEAHSDEQMRISRSTTLLTRLQSLSVSDFDAVQIAIPGFMRAPPPLKSRMDPVLVSKGSAFCHLGQRGNTLSPPETMLERATTSNASPAHRFLPLLHRAPRLLLPKDSS